VGGSGWGTIAGPGLGRLELGGGRTAGARENIEVMRRGGGSGRSS
jgi:hypothetical protein